MTHVTSLWLPILVSAVACHILSSIIHMAMPWHKNDYAGFPDEDGVLAALRPFAIPPGDYMAPKPSSMADMKSPAFIEKHRLGPVLVATVMPGGPMSMTANLIQWFVYLVVVIGIAAALAGASLPHGAGQRGIFHHVGVACFLGFAAGWWPMSIWYHRKWSSTFKATFDSLIYAAVTAWIFTLLWPK